MTPEDFISALRKEVVGELLDQYKGIYQTPLAEVTDAHYKQSIALYNSLDKKQQTVLFAIKRQVIVDAISSLLAILDNVSMLSSQDEILELREKGGQLLNGELQDIFLIQEENNPPER